MSIFTNIHRDYNYVKDIKENISIYKYNNYNIRELKKVKQLIIIFIDNAIKYTKENDRISIDIEPFKDKVKISIIDSGIGIIEDEQPKIFNRFYRGVNLRKENIEGSGVGLAITKI